jgi:hypothetical protein
VIRLISRICQVSVVLALLLAIELDAAWFRGNTNTHTLNSDGDSAPDTVARWYREHRYQLLFITDHEYLTDPGPLNGLLGAKNRFLLLPGQEMTQWGEDPKRSSAHVNALFIHEVIFPMGDRKCAGSGCGATVSEGHSSGDDIQHQYRLDSRSGRNRAGESSEPPMVREAGRSVRHSRRHAAGNLEWAGTHQ